MNHTQRQPTASTDPFLSPGEQLIIDMSRAIAKVLAAFDAFDAEQERIAAAREQEMLARQREEDAVAGSRDRLGEGR